MMLGGLALPVVLAAGVVAWAFQYPLTDPVRTWSMLLKLGHMPHALELNATSSYAYRSLGIYYRQQDELELARQQFDRAAELDPATDLLADYRAQLQSRLDETSSDK